MMRTVTQDARPTVPPTASATTRPVALFRYAITAGGRGWRLTVGALGFAGHQLGEVMVPVAVGLVVDRAIAPGNSRELLSTVLLLAAVFVLLIASWQTADRMITRVHARGEHALRQWTVASVLRRSRARRAPGEVLTISSADAAQVAGFSWVVGEQAGAVAALVAAGVVLASISWSLVGGVLFCTVFQIVLVHRMSGRLRRRSYEAQVQAARIDALGTDFALGLRALEALGATEEANERYRAESAIAARAAYRADRANAALSTVNSLASGLAFAGIAAIAGTLALHQDISIGAFIIGVGLAQAVRRPLQAIGYLPGSVAAKHGSARRVGELLDPSSDSAQPESTALPESTVRPVVSTAEGHPTVHLAWGGLDLPIVPGLVVGIHTGDAAATDLGDLLGARRPPLPGELVIDGTDAVVLPAADLRRIVFAPPHNSAVFSGTLRDNLAGDGQRPITDDDPVIAASGLDEVVARLPGGLDESAGENGGRLSGGQRQRVLLARALRTPHPVVVLHNPTTAIDPVTETRIARTSVAHLRSEGRTVVLITASPVLLSSCDEVHVVAPDGPRGPHR